MKFTTFDEKDKGARQYFESWANPHPPQTQIPREYFIGDIYERYEALADEAWPGDDPRDGPYARRVKFLARNGWPQLRYLSDFLDCSTVPIKQRALIPEDREERLNRVHVIIIDLQPGKDVLVRELDSVQGLKEFVTEPWADVDGNIRLFVIEDLSTHVIEILGNQFNIDPGFFRSHISDYAWFNVADPWMEFPGLPSRLSLNAFFTLRHVRPYYFRNEEAARRARRQAGGFNVLRRIDFDKTNSWSDTPGSSVGTVRAKTSCYIRPQEEAGQGWLGKLEWIDLG